MRDYTMVGGFLARYHMRVLQIVPRPVDVTNG